MQPQYPTYPPQAYPPQPQYPPQPLAPPMTGYGYPYPPQPMPGYSPQAPVQPTVAGSLDDFYDQPATGSKAWVFKDRPMGTTYRGIVERALNNSDVRQQTNQQGVGQTYRDGRPKFVMVVPMLVAPDAEFPEGRATWWVKGQARDELARAMSEAGAPPGPPEAGATITVRLTGQRPVPGMNPAYIYQVHYIRPTGVGGAPATPAPMANPMPAANPAQQQAPQNNQPGAPYGWMPPHYPPVQPLPTGQWATGPQGQQWHGGAPQQPTTVMGMDGQLIPALNIGPNVTPPMGQPAAPVTGLPATSGAPQPPMGMPPALNPEQQNLLNTLLNQQAAAQQQPTS